MAELFFSTDLLAMINFRSYESFRLTAHTNLSYLVPTNMIIGPAFVNRWTGLEKSHGHEGSRENVDSLEHLRTLVAELFLSANLLAMFNFCPYGSFRLEPLRISPFLVPQESDNCPGLCQWLVGRDSKNLVNLKTWGNYVDLAENPHTFVNELFLPANFLVMFNFFPYEIGPLITHTNLFIFCPTRI